MSEIGKSRALEALGGGGRADLLNFRLVARVLLRCLGLMRPVAGHVAALLLLFAILAVTLLPFGLLLLDVVWTRVLAGEPLLPVEATLLGLDPRGHVDVVALEATARRTIAMRVMLATGAVSLLLLPATVALVYYRLWLLQSINQILRVQLLDRLQALSLRFHTGSRVGDALYRLYQDSAMVTQLIDVLILTPLRAGSRFAISLVVVAAFDPRLALALLVVWPPLLLLGRLLSKPMRVRFRTAREANSRLTSQIQETLTGIRVIKAYGAERFEQQRFERASESAFDAAYEARDLFALFQVLAFWAVGTVVVVVAAAGALSARDAAPLALTAAGFTAWNLGLFNFFKDQSQAGGDAGRDLMRTWARVQDIAIGLDRVFEVLDLQPEVRDAPDAIDLEEVRTGIAYRDVHFAYDAGNPVLRGASLFAPVGSITAIVGPTGSGKSTLLALLLRLFDPDQGNIEIDGVDLRRFRTASLRERVAIALQENLLFGETVRENIRFGRPTADDAAIQDAAGVACADEFIRELSDGYDTLLGERGSKLSTGQRQRLSIARAVLKDAPILILDEPTASLDADTERRVLRNLAEWGRGRAIFLITHRLSTITRADQIVVLEEGTIAESGSHAELMARLPGVYRRLVEASGQTGAAA